ncbi:MAG: hypothetical protein ABI266_06555 [Ginsengibacter sp.]
MKKINFVLFALLFFMVIGCSKKDSPMPPAPLPPPAPVLSSAKDIVTFSFLKASNTTLVTDVVTVINAIAHTISSTVPFGTNVTALVASFSNSAKSAVKVGDVAQISGTSANNFSSPVTYSVKAEDGSSQNYKVTLAVGSAPAGINVYVAGNIYQGNKDVAVYWKNGVLTKLTNGTNDAYATSIIVNESDVYVAGFENNGVGDITVAKYWKNGIAITLTDGTNFAVANSIVIRGSDIYVAGSETNAQYVRVAKLWKNGVAISITDGTRNAQANSIAINGSDVYLAGNEENNDGHGIVKYWKNGVGTNLSSATNYGNAGFIAVNSTNVYVSGSETGKNSYNGVARFWKNGIPTSLTDSTQNAYAGSIFLSGNDVFLSGSDGKAAKYWKNGVPITLNGNYIFASGNCIALDGTDVYVAGSQNFGAANYPVLWKNGIATPLSGGSVSGMALSMTLVP